MNNSVPMDHMDLLLYAAMDMADSDDLISEPWEASDESVCLSRKADRRIWKTLCRIRENREKQQPFHPVREILKRVAMIVLITATVGFTCLMSIDAIREAVWKFFTQWNEKSITVEIKPEKDVPMLTEIQEYKEPVVSSEFKRTEIRKNAYSYVLEYERNGTVISYRQRLLEDFKTMLSNNDTKMYEIGINQNSGIYTVFETHGVTIVTILWHDEQYVYKVSGNLDFDSLLSIAESIP